MAADSRRRSYPESDPDPVIGEIAEYVLSFEITSQLAYEGATYCLMDTLACGFQALNVPACTKLLGPIVPGATLSGGARVPGTSYELDPIHAAFNIGAMIRWLDVDDTWLATEGSQPSDSLGAILAIADYLSRSGKPVKVRDVLTGMIKAQEIQGILDRVGLDHLQPVRVASTAVVTAMLGGTRDQIINAVSNAWIDGGIYRSAPTTGSRKSWATADASSRAVRHALFALKDEMGYPSTISSHTWGGQGASFMGTPIVLPQPFGSYVMEDTGKRRAEGMPVLVKKFESSVATHFGPRQTELIKRLFDDHDALAAMPVSDFVAKLVSAS